MREDLTQTKRQDRERAKGGALPDMRVMLIVDNPVDVVFLRGALAALKTGTFAITVATCLAKVQGRPSQGLFDVVITDLGLPDSKGLSTFLRVREWAGEVPIIVLTAHDNEVLGLQAVREGAHDYLVKGQFTGAGVARAIRYAVDQSRVEEQLRQSQRMEAVGLLAGGIAHEFNNLLQVVEGHVGLLLAQILGAEETRESLSAIRQATQRQAALTRQLLTFGRQQVMVIKPLDFTELVKGLHSALLLILGETIELELPMTSDELWIDGDKGMLEQVLFELAANARDAMPGGGRWKISLAASPGIPRENSAEVASPGHSHATLIMEDCGGGMPPTILARIYEPFFTTKDVGQGSGLGLAMAHSIVDQHRGWLEVSSEVGKGTSFRLNLPLRGKSKSSAPQTQGQDIVSAPTPTEAVQARGGAGAVTILLVEDEAALRSLAKKVLERSRYVVLAAASGPDARQIWDTRGEEIGLLFTDLVLPGGQTGQQLANELRAQRPGLPVLYTSGYSADFSERSAPFREGDNFIQKPYAIKTLVQAVERMLASKTRPGDPAPPARTP